MKDNRKKIIGRVDKLDFPDLHLVNVDTKIDTGAFSSAIHCHHIEEFAEEGEDKVRFKLLDPSHPEYNNREYVAKKYMEKKVKSSFGKKQKRVAIKATVVVFGQKIETEFSLTDRAKMSYPILLGRTFLHGNFLVDVDRKNLSFKAKKRKEKQQ